MYLKTNITKVIEKILAEIGLIILKIMVRFLNLWKYDRREGNMTEEKEILDRKRGNIIYKLKEVS